MTKSYHREERKVISELLNILRQRAEVSLDNNSWNTNTLEKVAELSQGDARIAIQTLRKAAEIAEASNAQGISQGHINQAWDSTKGLKKKYLLGGLTEHHRIIHDIIKKQPRISSGKLWESYLKACAQNGRRPMATRTVSAYLKRLIDMKLIFSEQKEKRGEGFQSFVGRSSERKVVARGWKTVPTLRSSSLETPSFVLPFGYPGTASIRRSIL